MQFAKTIHEPHEEGIQSLVSEKEKRERIQKALEIHMLENREAHLSGELPVRAEQIEQAHSFGKTMQPFGAEYHGQGQPSRGEGSSSVRAQQPPQEEKLRSPVRKMCECCMRFLCHSFGMDPKEAQRFMAEASHDEKQMQSYQNQSGYDSSSLYIGQDQQDPGDGGSGGNYSHQQRYSN